jgi:hypothetical protein
MVDFSRFPLTLSLFALSACQPADLAKHVLSDFLAPPSLLFVLLTLNPLARAPTPSSCGVLRDPHTQNQGLGRSSTLSTLSTSCRPAHRTLCTRIYPSTDSQVFIAASGVLGRAGLKSPGLHSEVSTSVRTLSDGTQRYIWVNGVIRLLVVVAIN